MSSQGWNQVQLNLSDLTKRAYGTNYVETLRVTIHANCRIRRVYFTDRLHAEDDLPPEFKLYQPVGGARGGGGRQQQEQQAAMEVEVVASSGGGGEGEAGRG